MSASTLPADHPVVFSGAGDLLGQTLPPMYTEIARAFGPVMMQEIAVFPAGLGRQQDFYLRINLPEYVDDRAEVLHR